jgi:hypothetical protein
VSDQHEGLPEGRDRPVQLIFDTSAVVAFSRASIHVGELLAEVHDEGAAAAIPLPCLVEAVHAVADTDRLHLLLAHHATVILTDDPTSWQALATTYDIVGRPDAAAAALAAIDYGVAVLTRQPGLYAGLDPDGRMVIPIEE